MSYKAKVILRKNEKYLEKPLNFLADDCMERKRIKKVKEEMNLEQS